MIFLVLAVLSSVLVSLIMRISEKHIHNNISMLAANYLMCTVLAMFFTGTMEIFPQSEGLTFCLGLGAVSGAFYLGSFMLLQWNISQNGVVLSSMFMKLGVIVPTVMSMVFFSEVPQGTQVIGIIAALAAILLINLEKGQGKAASGTSLILLLLIGGGTDAMSKVFEVLGQAELKNHFLMYTFAVALALCIAACVTQRQKVTLIELGFGLLLGIPNYFSARFLLLSLTSVPAVIAYPSYSVMTIVILALAGMALFHERLSKKHSAAMVIILGALILLNV